MLKSMNRQDYYEFRLSYWDWRSGSQTEENSPFKENRLGTSVEYGTERKPIVNGRIFGPPHNWNTYCWSFDNNESQSTQVCNPNANSSLPLQRCPKVDENEPSPCDYDNTNWPTKDNVNNALGNTIYDIEDFDRLSHDGFRNYLEGFKVVDDCNENRFCAWDKKRDRNILRTLHNTVSTLSYRSIV